MRVRQVGATLTALGVTLQQYQKIEDRRPCVRIGKLLSSIALLLAMCGGMSSLAQLSQQDQALQIAVSNNSPDKVKDALKHHANIEVRDSMGGTTPLTSASHLGYTEVIKVLLEYHANIDARDGAGYTAVNRAVEFEYDKPDVLKLLLEHHANPDATLFGDTPLIRALSNGRIAVAKLLLENHANLEAKDNFNGQTPLILAAASGNIEMVKLLLENHANLEAKDNNGNTPLMRAAWNGNADMVRLLLENHASLEATNGSSSPLITATLNGKADIVKLLLDNHANPEAKDSRGQTPLIWAASADKADVVKVLLEYHANLEAADNNGYTPLLQAVSSDKPDMVKLLLENHANLEAKNSVGDTPLKWAVSNGNAGMVKLLLLYHPDLETKNQYGYTPLIQAASNGHTDIVKLLLENHANIEAKDNGGSTPLIWAAISGKADVVNLLLEDHANIEAKDNNGNTPLILAAISDKADIVRLLLEHHADPGAKTSDGQTVIDLAAKYGRCEVVSVLEQGAQTKTLACLQNILAQYQKSPSDSLRDSILHTALAMNPPPEIPEEARRPFIQANTLFKTAQSDADTKMVLGLYRDALSQAPWFADAWYNQSLTQEKAGYYAGALASMKNFQQLEPGGATDRAALDRIYTLEAEGKSTDAKRVQAAALDAAATTVRRTVGGYTLYRFWLIRKLDGTDCSRDEASMANGPCHVWDSANNAYTGHDGSPMGAQATVSAEGSNIVLALGTQRFCIPQDQVAMLSYGGYWNTTPVKNVTDCNSPPEAVPFITVMQRAQDPTGGAKDAPQPINGTATIAVLKCPDSECRHADMAIYWLKP
ncbi:MAG: ankyrin repeat domain-containing protein [Thiobacillaceae bacterium]